MNKWQPRRVHDKHKLEEQILQWKQIAFEKLEKEYPGKGNTILNSILNVALSMKSFSTAKRYIESRNLPSLSEEQIALLWNKKWG